MAQHAIAALPASPADLLNAATADPEQLAVIGFLASYRGKTRPAYEQDLKRFYAFTRTAGVTMLTVTKPHLELFLRGLEQEISPRTQRPLAQATIARTFGTVNTFLEYAEGEDLIVKNPARRVRRPKVDRERQKRTWLEVGDFMVLKRAAKSDKTSAQDGAVVMLMASTAMRVAEICSLNVDSVHMERGRIYVEYIRKGDRQTQDAISWEVYQQLEQFITDRDPDAPLFLNACGRRLDQKAVQRVLDRVMAAADLHYRLTPHGMRRTFVTTASAIGVPMDKIQEAVHHSSPATTALYRMHKGDGAQATNAINDLLAQAG